ncbi:hypothetical protein B0H13DRAFT_1861141 [Mycena leptocephala]|nr:hypothetical protein B0H13DRAFT_1861141 [Mycena leptocephala]
MTGVNYSCAGETPQPTSLDLVSAASEIRSALQQFYLLEEGTRAQVYNVADESRRMAYCVSSPQLQNWGLNNMNRTLDPATKKERKRHGRLLTTSRSVPKRIYKYLRLPVSMSEVEEAYRSPNAESQFKCREARGVVQATPGQFFRQRTDLRMVLATGCFRFRIQILECYLVQNDFTVMNESVIDSGSELEQNPKNEQRSLSSGNCAVEYKSSTLSSSPVTMVWSMGSG